MDDVDMRVSAEEAMVAEEAQSSVDLDEYKMVAVPHYERKLRLPKIFNYYYILDTSDPTGKSLRAMCKTCETTICYSRRATSNLITHLKRKHPLNYADYAELQAPSFINSPQSSYISQTPDPRGEQIILQVQDQQQMIDLTKPQYEVSQAVTRPGETTYSTYGTTSVDTSTSQVMNMTGHIYPSAAYDHSSSHHRGKRKLYDGRHLINTTVSTHSMSDNPQANHPLNVGHLRDPREWLLLFMADSMLPSSVATNPYFKGFVASLNKQFSLPSEDVLNNEWIPKRQESLKLSISHQMEAVEKVCIVVSKHQASPSRHLINFSACFIRQWEFQRVLLACRVFNQEPPKEIVTGIIEELTDEYKLGGKVIQVILEEGREMPGDFNLPGFVEESANGEEDEKEEKPQVGESFDLDGTASDQWLPSFEINLQHCISGGLKDIQQISDCVTKLVHLSEENLPNGIGSPGMEKDALNGWLDQIKFLKVAINTCNDDAVSETILSEVERQLFDELFDTLEPFEDAMDYIAKHKENIPISFAIPCIRGLQRHLQLNNQSSCQRLLFQLKAALIRHLSKFESSKLCKLAASLDPRFKMAWCSDHESGSIKALLVKEAVETAQECNLYRADFSQSDKVAEEAGNTSKLFKLMESPQQGRPNFQEAKVQEEVNNYLSLPCSKNTIDPLQYWKEHMMEFPTLSVLASRVLCVPSASPARDFVQSVAGDLSESDTENLMFIRNNSTPL